MNKLKGSGTPKTVDMSPEAIARRLAAMEDLFQLGLSLKKAQPITDDRQATEEDRLS